MIGLSTGIHIQAPMRRTNASGLPQAMQPPSLNVDSDTQITVTLSGAPQDGGSTITGYDLRYRTNAGAWSTQSDVASATTLSGLSENLSVEVQSCARNANGAGPWSGVAAAVTLLTAPAIASALPAQVVDENTGVQALDLVVHFTGSSLTYAITPPTAGLSITGLGTLEIDTDVLPVQSDTAVGITASNTSGSVSQNVLLTVNAAITPPSQTQFILDGQTFVAAFPNMPSAPPTFTLTGDTAQLRSN